MRGWSEEQRSKHSVAMKKYYAEHSDAREKSSKALKKYCAEHPNARQNKKWSEEEKEKHSEKMKIVMNQPEMKRKLSEIVSKWHKEHPEAMKEINNRSEKKEVTSKSMKEYRKEHPMPSVKGLKWSWSEEAKRKHSKIQKRVQGCPEAREANSKRSKIRWSNLEERKRQSERITEMINAHPEIREANSKSAKIRMNCPRRKKYQSKCATKNWKDPEYRRKVHAGWMSSNKKEQFNLYNLIKSHYFTTEWEYRVRRHRFDIAIPEYKIDIEYDGIYWHPPGNLRDVRRDKTLQKLGWTVLRVREREQFDINTLHKLVSQLQRKGTEVNEASLSF